MTVEPPTNVESNRATIELVNGIVCMDDHKSKYADNINLSFNHSTIIPIDNCKKGCILWEIKSDNDSIEYEVEHMQHYLNSFWKVKSNTTSTANEIEYACYYLGLFWKCTEPADGHPTKNTIAYVFTSEKKIIPNKKQLSRIITYIDAALSCANDDKYTYTLPNGKRFGISIKIPDNCATNLCVQLYQENALIHDGIVNNFSSLDGVVLQLLDYINM